MTNGLFGLLNLDMDSYHILGGHKTPWEWLRANDYRYVHYDNWEGETWVGMERHGPTWGGMDRPGHFERPYHLELTRFGPSLFSPAAFPPQVFLLYLHRLQN